MPAVVLKLVADNYAHGRLGMVRSLGRLGVPVHQVVERSWNPTRFSRHSRGAEVWPLGAGPPDDALDRLVALGRRLEGRPVLLCGDDAGALFVDRHAEALAPVFRFHRQPPGLVEAMCAKDRLPALCSGAGVATPPGVVASTVAGAQAFAAEVGYPVMVKTVVPPDTRPREVPSVQVARDPAGLARAVGAAAGPDGHGVLVQERLPDEPGGGGVLTFDGYLDGESRCRLGMVGRKVHQHPWGSGGMSLGELVTDPAVERASVTLLGALGYRGPVDLDWYVDPRDGRVLLLDANPRVGANFRLFSGGGMDVARAAYLDLTGARVPAAPATEGRRFVVEPFEVWSFSAARRRGDATARGWWPERRGLAEAAWFALDDPLPFLAMIAVSVALPARARAAGRRGPRPALPTGGAGDRKTRMFPTRFATGGGPGWRRWPGRR